MLKIVGIALGALVVSSISFMVGHTVGVKKPRKDVAPPPKSEEQPKPRRAVKKAAKKSTKKAPRKTAKKKAKKKSRRKT